MKTIPVKDSVGSILCHDITQIIPGIVKDIAFKKGHVILEEDIPLLLSIGKENIYVWEKKEGYLHENDAAERLRILTAGVGLRFSEVKEGKVNFIADYPGLLKINTNLLYKLNSLGEIILVTLHNNYPVKKGQKVAGTRVIPLVIEEDKIKRAEDLMGDEKIVSILPFTPIKVGIITTGSEVYHGRIKDAFGPVIRRKVEEYGCEVLGQIIVNDDENKIKEEIEVWIEQGAEMVICTGGMSVDPDDVTPTAILKTGAQLITYGAPVLPGAMFLLAYKGEIPILGLPGCVMYSRTTIFDLVLPRILANEKLSFADIAAYGHGGLCNECEECKYPDCAFGKGV
jgi:molybdenum cofactor synthesis domain-containing protein